MGSNQTEKIEKEKPLKGRTTERENEKAQAKLAAQAPKKPEKAPDKDNKQPKKKEKNWTAGVGTTSAETQNGDMKASTTGLKFENKKKKTEITLGLTSIEEQRRPGDFPTNTFLPGISFKKNF